MTWWSDMARLLDAAREFLGPVQKVERGEIVAAADIVFPALAGPKQNAAVVAARRLAGLHIEMIGMQRDFTRNGDAALIGAKIVDARHKCERCGELLELTAGVAMEEALRHGVIRNWPSKVEG